MYQWKFSLANIQCRKKRFNAYESHFFEIDGYVFTGKKVRGTQRWINLFFPQNKKRAVCIVVEMLTQVSYVFKAKGTVSRLINWFNTSGYLKSLTEEIT